MMANPEKKISEDSQLIDIQISNIHSIDEDDDCEIVGYSPKVIPIIEINDESDSDFENETDENKLVIAEEDEEEEKNNDNDLDNDKVSESNENKKGLEKLDIIISHVNHNVKIHLKRLICMDCNTRICPVCYENFPNHLKHHIYHDSEGKFICSKCSVEFRTPCALKAHENLHNDVFPLVCPDCGALYQQTKYFLNHSLCHCSHLYKQARFHCSLCDASFGSALEFREHIQEHVPTKYFCRICQKDVGAIRAEALDHFKKRHDVHLTSKTLTFGLDVTTFCAICYKFASHDHFKTHLQTLPKTVIVCPCGLETNMSFFRTHRYDCKSSASIPLPWKNNLPQFRHKNSEDALIKKCIRCGEFSGIENFCEDCNNKRVESSKCQHCLKTKRDVKNLICEKCTNLLSSSICVICASHFKPKENKTVCNACTQKHSVESTWLGGEQIISNLVDEFETRELTYDDHPSDHLYCRRQDFISQITNTRRKLKNQSSIVSNSVKPNLDHDNNKPAQGDNKYSTIKCYLCKSHLNLPGNYLYKLLIHIKKCHPNAVLPTSVPPSFVPIENEELDLMSRLKILEEKNQNHLDENQVEDVSKPRKRMRLYVPQNLKKGETVIANGLKPIEQKENTSENVSSNESSPPKKDHEFWDEVYDTLSKVDKKKGAKIQMELLYENLSGYSSKRQVKKPIRLVEQEVVKQQSLSRKSKHDNEGGPSVPTTPESLKMKEFNKKEIVLGDEPCIVLEKKKKRCSEEIDHELVKVKNKLKNDNELGFLAKTFHENQNQTPNKRKRKLASKLVYNKVIDVLNEDVDNNESISSNDESSHEKSTENVCAVCSVSYSNKEEFKEHLLTHRKISNSHQCMECGVCFMTLSVLLKHLQVSHKVLDTINYLIGNNYRISDKEDEVEKEVIEKVDESIHKCKVCHQIFPSPLELSKHFRIHGMAFLKESQKDIKQI